MATLAATAAATAAALAFHRHRFRRQGRLEALLTLPTVAPEIVLAASMLLVFAALGLRLGFLTVILSHAAFTVSYGYVVVRARIAGFDHSLEEAALDLGARPLQDVLEGDAAADPAGRDGGGVFWSSRSRSTTTS